MFWIPERIWEGSDATVIGGGPSLSSFDWGLLQGKNTIGCNTAFTLGPEICKVCFFGDKSWFSRFEDELKDFQGIVVTNHTLFQGQHPSWLKAMRRWGRGLHRDGIGWNKNSGAAALNLALLFGAKRVFLLGFDMKPTQENKPNWHDRAFEEPKADVYDGFLHAFKRVADDLPRVFPGCEVFNVTDDSRLDVFPKVSLADHFSLLPQGTT
jgi:hypothetical protein